MKTCTASPPSMLLGTSTFIPTTMTDMELLEERIYLLQLDHALILQLEQSLSQGMSLSKEEQEECLGEFKRRFMLLSSIPYQESPSRDEDAGKDIIDLVEIQDKERYLCVSDGFTICCLDLKQSTDECKEDGCSGLLKVPSKISTLELLEERLPFSLGLFKSGSLAYMVGGQEFSGLKDSYLSDLKEEDPSSDWDVFCSLYEKYGVIGTSCSKIYHLTLAYDDSLLLSPCFKSWTTNIPKTWPIVEKIDDKLHVIDSLPSPSLCSLDHSDIRSLPSLNRDMIRSLPSRKNDQRHEVLKMGWGDCRTVVSANSFSSIEECGVYIRSHIVVGDRIYARDRYCYKRFAVFDSKTNKWKSHQYPSRSCSMLHITHVAEILRYGFGSCIGEFMRGEFAFPPLYVVLAIGSDEKMGMISVAYLVTPTGQILCYQRLNRFFDGFKKPFANGSEGTVISCGGGAGNTMCAILRGYGKDSLSITTFTWEAVDNALALVMDLHPQIRGEVDIGKFPFTDEESFVKVVVKGWYISQLGTRLMPVSGKKLIPPVWALASCRLPIYLYFGAFCGVGFLLHLCNGVF